VRAWRVHELGAPESALCLDDIDAPTPGPGQVAIAVRAASLNFPDVLMCLGQYQLKPELPFSPGAEVAGVVEAIGDGVTRVAVGDRVLAIPVVGFGGFAEHTVAHESTVHAIPDAMSFDFAAALHVTYQTGYLALHRRAQLQSGETLLVHAGAGGVGSAAIQLGKAAGARVIATAGGAAKRDLCLELGADHAIDYQSEDFVAEVKEYTSGRGADVIFDPVGGDVFDRSRKCIAFEGRLLVIGFTSGRIPEAPANHVLIKNYSVVGVHWGLYLEKAPSVVPEVHAELVRLFEAGRIRPYVTERIDFEAIPAALTRLAGRGTTGKVVAQL